MISKMKLLFAKLTILSAIIALGAATYYFNQEHPLVSSFQLAMLVAVGTLAGAAIFFYILSLLLMPLFEKMERSHEESTLVEEIEPVVIPREERIIRHKTKEEYIKNSRTERVDTNETQQKLTEMAEEQGTVEELMLILPLDLSFLLAKESLHNLFFGKIIEENEETGTLVGTAGLGSSPQEFRLTIQAITKYSSNITIISKSHAKKQSDKKNAGYIKKISDFLREKEKFYTE